MAQEYIQCLMVVSTEGKIFRKLINVIFVE
jgi:hypothetical protein